MHSDPAEAAARRVLACLPAIDFGPREWRELLAQAVVEIREAYAGRTKAVERGAARDDYGCLITQREWNFTAKRCDILAAKLAEKDAEIERLARKLEKADARICVSCLESHPLDSPCPPHEMRSSGPQWFRERLAAKDAEIRDLKMHVEVSEMMRGDAVEALALMDKFDGDYDLWAEMKRQRDSAVSERDRLSKTLSEKDSEIAKLRFALQECEQQHEIVACDGAIKDVLAERDRLAAEVERLKTVIRRMQKAAMTEHVTKEIGP